MLGPEGHLYDPLPSSTSIRVLLLAPGQADDDIFGFLYPCDLEKDRTIDHLVPRPFQSLCAAQATRSGDGNEQQTFWLYLDSYIEESEQSIPLSTDAISETSSSRADSSSKNLDELTQGPTVVYEHDKASAAYSLTEEDGLSSDTRNSETRDESQDEELSDDMWDLTQLAKLTFADGNLDDRVRRHPFQRYSALSYVWGSENAPECITIDGNTKFWVTRNLYDALKCLRQPNIAQALWIDAICINQSEPEEKKIQIGLMRRVYRQAQKVIAYLPQVKEDSESFIELVNKIVEAYGKCKQVIDSGDIPIQRSDEDEENAENVTSIPEGPDALVRVIRIKPSGTCIEDHGIPGLYDPVWGSWRRFFAAPYFRRIWILQEYALAQDLYFQSGCQQINANLILLLLDCFENRSRLLSANYLMCSENHELEQAAMLGWMGLKQMVHTRIAIRHDLYDGHDRRLKLIDRLDISFMFDATDPRDKIYALMGLVSDAEQFMELVSYETTVTHCEIYRRFARALIEKGYLAQVLHMACRTANSSQLATWIPDWSVPTMTSLVATIPQENEFRAGGDKPPPNTHFLERDKDQIVLSGLAFSTIVFKTSAFVPRSTDPTTNDSSGSLLDLYETIMLVMRELSTYLAVSVAATVMDLFYVVTLQSRRITDEDRKNPEGNQILQDLQLFRTFLGRIFHYSQLSHRDDIDFSSMPEEDMQFGQRVFNNTKGRSICVTKDDKRVGMVSDRAQIGDCLAIFDGVPVPLVLHEVAESATGTSGAYKMVGDAYITGVMQGELVQDHENVVGKITLV